MSRALEPVPPTAGKRTSTSRKRKSRSAATRNKSRFQGELEHAIQVPGGVVRTLDLVRGASKVDIRSLPHDWSPLPCVIFLVGATYGRRALGSRMPRVLLPTLLELIGLCHDRGISIDGGSIQGAEFHRPLVLAAYYGFPSLVEKLLDLKAIPDLGDGEGRTAFHAALQNPSVGRSSDLRACDREVAQLLVQRGVVTPSLRQWRCAPKGSMIYANGDSSCGSALLAAIRNKNTAAFEFLIENGAVLTDRDYLHLIAKRGYQQQVLAMVSKCLLKEDEQALARNPSTTTVDEGVSHRRLYSWSKNSAWSFPPTWKVTVALSHHCGLPEDLFSDHVVPFLSRDWFFTKDQISGPLPALLGASMERGQHSTMARSFRWKHDNDE